MARNQAEHLTTTEKQKQELTIFQDLYKLVHYAGYTSLCVIKGLVRAERKFSRFLASKLEAKLKSLCDKTVLALKQGGQALFHPFWAIGHGVVVIAKAVSEAKKDGKNAFGAGLRTIAAGAKNNGWFFRGLLNYTAAAFGIGIVFAAVTVFTNLNVAVAVEYEGQQLGYIENEAVYNTASKMLQERIAEEEDQPEFSLPTFRLAVVSKSEITNEDELADTLLQSASEDIVEANGVYIDGKFYGAVAQTGQIEETVEALLAKYRTGRKNETVELAKPVELKAGLYLPASVVEEEEIVSLLNSEVAGEVRYTVQAGETPSGVAKKNGISYSDFKAMNPDCETKFFIGQEVYIAKSEPFMPVKVTRRETYRTETKFQTETKKDNTKSLSYEKVTQKGKNGITEITADVSYVNGVEVARDQVSTKVIQKVVNEKITKGTKAPSGANTAQKASSGSSSIGNLKFMWPVGGNGGYVSSPFGWRRSRYHGGVDIAAPRGTPVYASESGVVRTARYDRSYGYHIIIDHGNGIQTLYAHSSKLLAKVGQKVNKGDVIMLIGSTGNSSGNHCHMEIRRNGQRINPLPYIR